MNPTHVTAALALAGFAANGLWTLLNIRTEARIGRKVDELKDYMENHYVCKLDCPVARAINPQACAQE